jgi:hypothetical protein
MCIGLEQLMSLYDIWMFDSVSRVMKMGQSLFNKLQTTVESAQKANNGATTLWS